MTFLLMVGLVILGTLLMDTRSRLKALEERQRNFDSSAAPARQTAKIVRAEPAVTMRSEWDERASSAEIERLSPWRSDEALPQHHNEEPLPATQDLLQELEPVGEPVSAPLEEVHDFAESLAEAAPGTPRIGFEELFGRKLPIWAGGATLAVAGVLLVKYSIDAGLLSPAVRVLIGMLFGSGLIAGAEFALQQEHRVQDPRVRQSLSGAGVASLYAAILAAANLYHLVSPATAFVGLAAVTALAMGLSLRFGAPSAVLGLVGGLAAPALVSAGSPNVPLLSCYLALAIAGLCAVSRAQRWAWLGVGALIGGAGWSAILVLTGGLDFASTLSVGFLVLALGVMLPLFAFADSRAILLRSTAVLIAAAQMAALVATGGFAMLHWGLYGLLSVAMAWLSGRDEKFGPIPAVGLGVGLLLAAFWPHPAIGQFTLVVLAIAVIYGGVALVRLWRTGGGMIEAGQIVGLAFAGFGIAFSHFHGSGGNMDTSFALVALGTAALPAIAAFMGWRNADRGADVRFATLAISSAVLVAVAALLGLTEWMLPMAVASVAVALLILANKAEDQRVEAGALTFLLIAAALLPFTDLSGYEVLRFTGHAVQTDALQALMRWLALAAATGLFAWRMRHDQARGLSQGGAALLGYGAVAQVVPTVWLAICIAAGLLAIMEMVRRSPSCNMMPAIAVLATLAGLWSLHPLVLWTGQALLSLGGIPMLIENLPGLDMVAQRLTIPALIMGVAFWRNGAALDPTARRAGTGLLAIFGAVSLHVIFKSVYTQFSMGGGFVHNGLAERTLWEALLMAGGFALWRCWGSTRAALVLVGAATVHNIWYSLFLHNPLWTEQAVGTAPVVNLLVPTFGMPLLGLWMAGQIRPLFDHRIARAFDIGRMIVILMFAFATLRQVFCGTVLVSTAISEAENILWSVLTIALAIGYLVWGIRRSLHDWRIASLVLMLGAVAKVFLLDASGLEGLLRIASFLALGFSLIGIGWLYNRYLRIEIN